MAFQREQQRELASLRPRSVRGDGTTAVGSDSDISPLARSPLASPRVQSFTREELEAVGRAAVQRGVSYVSHVSLWWVPRCTHCRTHFCAHFCTHFCAYLCAYFCTHCRTHCCCC
jgi:hypothetical protein